MAIKVAKKIKRTIVEMKETKPVGVSTLPPDEYKEEIDPKELVLDENGKLIISVQRGGEFGLPFVDIRYFATTERFTGFTKKGVNFPLEYLLDLMDLLREVSDECDEKGLE